MKRYGRLSALGLVTLAGLTAVAALLLVLGAARPAQAGGATRAFPSVECATTLQDCIDLSSPGDVINIAAGEYVTTFTLYKAVSLVGASAESTVISALGGERVINVMGGDITATTVISGLTFANGTGSDCSCGGAVLITGTAQPLLSHVVISNSLAGSGGGGLYAAEGSPVTLEYVTVISNATGSEGGGAYFGDAAVIRHSRFEGNSAMLGGGGLMGAHVTIENTDFISNTAINDSGGGVKSSAVVTAADSRFENNSAWYYGGGLAGQQVTLSGTQFVSNTAGGFGKGSGGGAVFAREAAGIADSLFDGNTCAADCFGGGLHIGGGASLSLERSRLLNNQAPNGGGLYLANDAPTATVAYLANNFFAFNEASEALAGADIALIGAGTLTAYHNSFAGGDQGAALYATGAEPAAPAGPTAAISLTNSIFDGYATAVSSGGAGIALDGVLWSNVATPTTGSPIDVTNAITGEAAFADRASGDLHLTAGSDAVDAGVSSPVDDDIDGEPRPANGLFDLGADELAAMFRLYLPLIMRGEA